MKTDFHRTGDKGKQKFMGLTCGISNVYVIMLWVLWDKDEQERPPDINLSITEELPIMFWYCKVSKGWLELMIFVYPGLNLSKLAFCMKRSYSGTFFFLNTQKVALKILNGAKWYTLVLILIIVGFQINLFTCFWNLMTF